MNLLLNNALLPFLFLAVLIASGVLLYYYIIYVSQRKYNFSLQEQYNLLLLQKSQLLAENSKLTASTYHFTKVNATKDQFFLMIGHDLKTPLLHLIDLLQTLNSQAASFSQDELKSFANQMNLSVKSLLALLDNLLQWSRFQSGKIEYQPVSIHLSEFIQKKLLLLNGQIESKNILFNIQIPDNILVTTDMHMFQTVLNNLLSYATSFSKENASILIKAVQEHNFVDFIIAYESGKIHSLHMETLFENEQYELNSGSEEEKNIRLGLLLCKELIEIANGKFYIKGNSKEGTVFTIVLPL